MDIMPRAGMVSPPPTGGGGGETRPETGQEVDPPSITFGFPFVPLRDWPEAAPVLPYTLATGVDDSTFPTVGSPFPLFGLGAQPSWSRGEER